MSNKHAQDINPGDTIRFTLLGKDYTVSSRGPHHELDGLIDFSFLDTGHHAALHPDTTVIATHMPRTFTITCLLCGDHFPHQVDLAAAPAPPIGGLCGTCNPHSGDPVVPRLYHQNG